MKKLLTEGSKAWALMKALEGEILIHTKSKLNLRYSHYDNKFEYIFPKENLWKTANVQNLSDSGWVIEKKAELPEPYTRDLDKFPPQSDIRHLYERQNEIIRYLKEKGNND